MRNSTYLYSHENRELYQDYLNDVSSKECHFSRQVPVFLEKSNEEDMSFFSQHLLNCSSCQESLRKEQESRSALQKLIPNQALTADLKASLQSEFREIGNILKEKEREQRKESKKEKLAARNQFFYDMTFGIFKSSLFIKGTLIAFSSYAFLYIILR